MGEPLVAEVSLPGGDRGNLEVVPAPAAAYSQHGLQAPERLGRITTTVVRTADGRRALRITSTGPVNDPIVDLLVQARDQSGRLDRQLTLLVSPAQMGNGSGQGGTAPSLQATRQPPGVVVQDARSSRSSRPRHPVHKKRALTKARRKSKTAAARKPVVAAAQAKTKVLPEVVNAPTLVSAAPPQGDTGQVEAPVVDTPRTDHAVQGADSSGIAAVGAVASGAAAPAGGAAAEPAANETGAAPAEIPANSVDHGGATPGTDASTEAAPKLAMPGTPTTRAPAEHAAGYGLWGGLAGLIALLLVGGLIWQRRSRNEPLLEAVEEEDAPGSDRGRGKVLSMGTAAVDETFQPEARNAAVSPVAADREPVHESLPDFGTTRAVPEDDPVAQADVYLSAGKVDEARAALEEGLWLDGDHVAILLKLLTLHADREDVGAFNESAARLAQETARSRQAWRRACAIGHRLDPSNALYTGDTPAVDGRDVDADGVSRVEQPLPGDSLRQIPGADPTAGGSVEEAALPFALEPMDAEGGDRIPPAALLEASRDDIDADATVPHSVADSDGANPESGLAEHFISEHDHHAVGPEQPGLANGILAAGPVAAPAALPETCLRAAANGIADLGSGSEGQPREDSLDRSGAAVTGGFDQLPSLLRQATERADGGNRQGALELAAEVARLLAELRNEALALASGGYA
ncbi:MAG: hypothetical protein EPN34_14240 [Burkholderiaceae bacterium]|nr:MAG: hypothetical protein EPN34_14240 [Burkholderiaceae bacterium]